MIRLANSWLYEEHIVLVSFLPKDQKYLYDRVKVGCDNIEELLLPQESPEKGLAEAERIAKLVDRTLCRRHPERDSHIVRIGDTWMVKDHVVGVNAMDKLAKIGGKPAVRVACDNQDEVIFPCRTPEEALAEAEKLAVKVSLPPGGKKRK